MKEIYLDHAATSYVDPRVLEAMTPFFSAVFANPSSFHTPGMRAKNAVTEARLSIAKILNSREEEIVFTSGGTESNNLALLGTIRANKAKGNHVINS